MVFQQGDALVYALDALAMQFLGTWCNGMQHVLHVGIVEQGAVHDAATRQMIGRRAADLPVANHDVVMTGANRINAQLPQEQQFHIDEAVEGKAYIVFRRHKGEHDIRPISIDAPSPTFPAYHVDVVLSAIVDIHLSLHLLVSSENDGGLHLPHKKAVFGIQMACDILLHSQEKGEFPGDNCLWQVDVQHDSTDECSI